MLSQPDVTPPKTEDDEIDFAALAATLWSGKAWIGGASALSMLAAAGYLLATPPVYEADALLQIEAGKSMLALPESMSDLLGNNAPSAMAELEILKSRQVLGRAVAQLNLAWQARPVLTPLVGQAKLRLSGGRDRASILLAYLEVPPEWQDQELRLTRTSETGFDIELVDGTVLKGKVDTLLTDRAVGFALHVRALVGPVGQTYTVTHRSELAAISALEKALTAAERGRQTGIIEVTLRDTDRRAASDQLNAVVRAYVDQNVSQSAAEAQKSLDFVTSQLPVAQETLTDAETKLNDFRARQKSVDLEFETQSLLTETTGIEGQLRELKLKEEELKQKYTPNHPVYRQLLEERAALGQRLGDLQTGITALPETQREIVNLTRNLDVAQQSYLELMNRAQELRVLSASQIGSVRIIDDAATKTRAVAPKSAQILGLSLVLGLVAGAGAVLTRNWLRRGINSVAEIERLGVPVFATINLLPPSGRDTAARHRVITRDDPDHIVSEAFRSLRTSLHFGMLDARTKSIVLTSPAPGAGKSFVAANLAVAAAQAGQRVCLIDADMRRGTQRKYFGFDKKLPGLADYLAEDADLDAVLRDTGVAGLSLILTGAFPPNPSELLMRSRLDDLITSLDVGFDLVIFDSPPALAVTDAVVIGRRVGSVIAVARHDVTPVGELEAVQKTLSHAGVPLKAAILNAYDPRKAKAGTGRYGYGYGYANRYAYARKGGVE